MSTTTTREDIPTDDGITISPWFLQEMAKCRAATRQVIKLRVYELQFMQHRFPKTWHIDYYADLV